MSTGNCAEELDFGLIFEEEGRQNAGPHLHIRTQQQASSQQPLAPPFHQHGSFPSQGSAYSAQGNLRAFDCPSIQITSIAANNNVDSQHAEAVGGAEGGYLEASWTRDQLYLSLDPCYRDAAFCPSPCSSLSSRSWMSDLSSCESFSQVNDDVDSELRDAALLALGSPGCGGGAFGVELWQQKYQNPTAFSPALSPHQSPSHSPRASVTEDNWLSRRPASRPSSRPTSPCGKRRHAGAEPFARSPSPQRSPSVTSGTSPRGSVTDDIWAGSPALGLSLVCGFQELDVPSKTRRTSGTQLALLASPADLVMEELRGVVPTGEESRDCDGLAELFLQVPSHFSWATPKPGAPPLFRTTSPPPLDSPLPSHFEHNELKLEVQPRPYHRAHYETEGSRGAIKAANGGHPVIKLNGPCERPASLMLFIGTADERHLRPHSFYQVHRVTGKTVTTTCQEKLLDSTKVLEIPLLPGNMSASIDCAGILKLRNADIELKKGETDIGRKNTRVRVVFRVGIQQSDGWTLWLQTASVPVECSQRSGQELPHVESFSPSSCVLHGGKELLIIGSNLSSQSRVVFLEKSPDGRVLWETDARVLPAKSCSSSITVDIPAYNRTTSSPVQVLFYVSNGKRRKSQSQSFTYLPGATKLLPFAISGGQVVKRECWEANMVSLNAPGPRDGEVVCYAPCDLAVHCRQLTHSGARPHHSPPPPLPHASLDVTAMMAPVIPGMEQAHKEDWLWGPGGGLSIKQEPEDTPPAASLGLQEITLDDVNEIIDRDISSLSGATRHNPLDQYHQCNWEYKSSDTTLPFSDGPP
ncbi:nuclear factor of activated T-cells, cytoplasmic 3 isoform X2 [Dunckerocampus dactyliophorus]|uniref:nuclear factor of activated T-cells, cytoplasmic 3 isoform X2 n=1 Tax=Dunckerocampus dactyliophorus TaxID=161453 RepID=UPI0024072BBD|nr:nuclear factor of activated T-cells, cytoplasmic 3 isoform X2 [Dunckerocampus dactyliophorus]